MRRGTHCVNMLSGWTLECPSGRDHCPHTVLHFILYCMWMHCDRVIYIFTGKSATSQTGRKKIWAGRILQHSYCSVITHIWLILNDFILFALKSKASSVAQFCSFSWNNIFESDFSCGDKYFIELISPIFVVRLRGWNHFWVNQAWNNLHQKIIQF